MLKMDCRTVLRRTGLLEWVETTFYFAVCEEKMVYGSVKSSVSMTASAEKCRKRGMEYSARRPRKEREGLRSNSALVLGFNRG